VSAPADPHLPVRVALLTYSTRPRGGVVHTLALAEALAALGQHVTVWALGRGGDTGFYRPVDPAVHQRVVPFPDVAGESVGQRVLRSIAVLGGALSAVEAAGGVADVVHAQDCISANAAPGCLRTVHHVDHFSTRELRRCHDRAIREPAAHVCVSAAVAAELARDWGVRAEVIANGVDAERFGAAAGPLGQAARAAWRRRLGPYVLAVGGIEPRKGTLDLIEAMPVLRRALAAAGRPPLRLVIAGGETLFDYRGYRAAVEARAAALGVEPVVLGTVAQDELPSLVAAAQVFVFPSTQEGFGLAAMEALAAGVPVVARDLPVLREVFGDSVRSFADGPTAPTMLAAALLDAAHHPDTGRQTRGRALAARHTWPAAAVAHLALYRRLLAVDRLPPPGSAGPQAVPTVA